jgi:membrane protease YdiL (CAAX protease family)
MVFGFRVWAALGVCLFFLALAIKPLLDSATFVDRGTPTLFVVTFLAPVIEEFLFRSWLTNWLPGLYGGLFSIVLITIGLIWHDNAQGLLLFGLALVVVISGIALSGEYLQGQNGVSPLPEKRMTVLRVGILSAIVFALAHASNFDLSKTPYYWIPILVTPQLFAGIALMITRLRLGFIPAIILHSATNAEIMTYAKLPFAFSIVLAISLLLAKIAILGHMLWEKRQKKRNRLKG